MCTVACRDREITPSGGTGFGGSGAGAKRRAARTEPVTARVASTKAPSRSRENEESLLPVVGDRIDDEVCPLARCEDEGPGGLERRQGLAVQRHDPAFEPLRFNREDTRVRHVCDTKAKALAPGYRPGPGALAIDGDPVARPTPMGPVAHRTEALFVDPGLLGEAPVVEEKHFVTVDRRGILLFHDERAVESACHLFERTLVRVVPEGPCIRRSEVIRKISSGRRHGLRYLRRSVHRVRDPDPVPVYGRAFRKLVHEPPRHPVSLEHPDGGTWYPALVAPDGGLRVTGGSEACGSRPRMKGDGASVFGACR